MCRLVRAVWSGAWLVCRGEVVCGRGAHRAERVQGRQAARGVRVQGLFWPLVKRFWAFRTGPVKKWALGWFEGKLGFWFWALG